MAPLVPVGERPWQSRHGRPVVTQGRVPTCNRSISRVSNWLDRVGDNRVDSPQQTLGCPHCWCARVPSLVRWEGSRRARASSRNRARSGPRLLRPSCPGLLRFIPAWQGTHRTISQPPWSEIQESQNVQNRLDPAAGAPDPGVEVIDHARHVHVAASRRRSFLDHAEHHRQRAFDGVE